MSWRRKRAICELVDNSGGGDGALLMLVMESSVLESLRWSAVVGFSLY